MSSTKKFIPNGDLEFKDMANVFANAIAREPERWTLSEFDGEMLSRRVKEFDEALLAALNFGQRTPWTILRKNESRKKAEEIIRRLANIIRASDQIATADKLAIGIKERPKKLGKRTVPFAPPNLIYQGSPRNAGPNSGLHQLAYDEGFTLINRSKPNGAVRVELFVDLVAVGDPVPEFPGQYLGGRPWYLRSFTSSPMKVRHPVPPVPMLVVYWARWADAKGNVGPFSKTCTARVEGWTGSGTVEGTDKLLGPLPDVKQLASDPKYITTITQLRQIEQVRVEGLLPNHPAADDSAARRRELAGPPQSDAA